MTWKLSSDFVLSSLFFKECKDLHTYNPQPYTLRVEGITYESILSAYYQKQQIYVVCPALYTRWADIFISCVNQQNLQRARVKIEIYLASIPDKNQCI